MIQQKKDKRYRSMIIKISALIMAVLLIGAAASFTAFAETETEAITETVTEAVTEADTAAGTTAIIEEESGGFRLQDILLVPMGTIIRICYTLTKNYAVALLLFAIVMQAVLFPLGVKQQKNTNKQAMLRPKENAIRKKYAGRDDAVTKKKCNDEIMALYQQENFNPASGCLPLLIQLPIIFALFAVVRSPLTYITRLGSGLVNSLKTQVTPLIEASGKVINPGYEEISVISYLKEHGIAGVTGVTAEQVEAMPNFNIFGSFDMSAAPKDEKFMSFYILVPVLTFAVMMLSTWLTKKFTYRPPTPDGQSQTSMKIMEYMMPLMCVYFAYIVPSAIGIYWIYRNILSVGQQFVLSKVYPTPRFTEEEMLAAEREYLGKSKSKPGRSSDRDPNRPRPRSLHSIDFDDDETGRVTAAPVKKNIPEQGRIAPAPLKEDRPKGSAAKDDDKAEKADGE